MWRLWRRRVGRGLCRRGVWRLVLVWSLGLVGVGVVGSWLLLLLLCFIVRICCCCCLLLLWEMESAVEVKESRNANFLQLMDGLIMFVSIHCGLDLAYILYHQVDCVGCYI